LVASGEQGSVSQMKGRLASSTFGVAYDEAEAMRKEIKSILQTMVTKSNSFQQKGKGDGGQQYTVDHEYCSPSVWNFNKKPPFFYDPTASAFLERIILLKMEVLAQESPEWKHHSSSKPLGYLGRYLIDCTKEWSQQQLIQIYEDTNEYGFTTGKARRLVKVLGIGKYIAKEFFDVVLEYEDLHKIIDETQSVVADETLDSIIYLIQHGQLQEKNSYETKIVKENGKEVEKMSYKGTTWKLPNHNWIKTPVLEGKIKKRDGDEYNEGPCLTQQNIIELDYRINQKKSLKKSDLKGMLKKRIPHIQDTKAYLKEWNDEIEDWEYNNRVRCLLIPRNEFEALMNDDDGNDIPKHVEQVLELVRTNFSRNPFTKGDIVRVCKKELIAEKIIFSAIKWLKHPDHPHFDLTEDHDYVLVQ
jgi:hypothetical protein